MLSEKEIAEIEEMAVKDASVHWHWPINDIRNLISTVKELRKENTEQRELLRKGSKYMRHHPECFSHPRYINRGKGTCDCGLVELQKQIEEKLK